MDNNMTQEDIEFLGGIGICGAYPVLYRNDCRAQWNIGGMNFNDRCLQLQIVKEEDGSKAFLQVLRRSSSGGNNGNYNWTPLAEFPYRLDDETHNRILRETERWLGIQTSFRDWMYFNA